MLALLLLPHNFLPLFNSNTFPMLSILLLSLFFLLSLLLLVSFIQFLNLINPRPFTFALSLHLFSPLLSSSPLLLKHMLMLVAIERSLQCRRIVKVRSIHRILLRFWRRQHRQARAVAMARWHAYLVMVCWRAAMMVARRLSRVRSLQVVLCYLLLPRCRHPPSSLQHPLLPFVLYLPHLPQFFARHRRPHHLLSSVLRRRRQLPRRLRL